MAVDTVKAQIGALQLAGMAHNRFTCRGCVRNDPARPVFDGQGAAGAPRGRSMEKTWRWWGPQDAITLAHVRQAGATGIVTALDDVPAGNVWTAEAIAEHQGVIASVAAMCGHPT